LPLADCGVVALDYRGGGGWRTGLGARPSAHHTNVEVIK